ncbi:pre-B-cell leukemia transcription factor 2 [Platysternon megacephalum]|uniref:Pre-B-cell leukemia transcription factor 2 n=1 Tax=Platysternon megacephalum TaxID=55544 RepID=A0A4D9DJB6_9SAUR|nr:pre-B-cell leukemia transcription factor 2 [Platysternon megacephalum]
MAITPINPPELINPLAMTQELINNRSSWIGSIATSASAKMAPTSASPAVDTSSAGNALLRRNAPFVERPANICVSPIMVLHSRLKDSKPKLEMCKFVPASPS